MNSSLIDRFLLLLQSAFTEEYKLIRTGNCKQTFQEAFQWFLDKYADLSENDRSANKEEMIQQWNPADGFEKLVAQLTKGLIFAQYAGAPISDIDVVDMGITNILDTGLFKDEYKLWNAVAGPQKTFPYFKTFWAEQVRLMKRTTKTAGKMGYGMNAVQEEVDLEYDESCQMMAQAHLAQQQTMSDMSNTGTQMEAMQQQMNAMQTMFQQSMNMAAAKQPPTMYMPPPTMYGTPPNLTPAQHYQLQQPIPPNPYQQPYQPPYQQNGYSNNKSRRNGGRGGGGGRGNQQQAGGGNNYGRGGGGRGGSGRGGRGGGTQQGTDANYEVKSREFEKYCWTHGCDCSHNGFECEQQAMGHNPYATKGNPMQGNPKNAHRKYLPSTVGKPDNWRWTEAQQKKGQRKQQQYGGNATGFGAAGAFDYNSSNNNSSNGYGNGNFGNQQGFGNNF